MSSYRINEKQELYNGASSPRQDYQTSKDLQLDYSKEYKHAVTFLVLGVFTWIPLFYNIIYIRSPNVKAQKIAYGSLILAGFYFISCFLLSILGIAVSFQNMIDAM